MAIDTVNKKLYVVNTGGTVNNGNVTVIDIDPNSATYNTDLGPVANGNSLHPVAAVMDVANNTLFVANSGSSNITVFNFSSSYTSPATSTISLTHSATALAFNPSLNVLYATEPAPDGVALIDTTQSPPVVFNTVPLAPGCAAIAIDNTGSGTAYCAAGNNVYVISGYAYSKTMTDPNNGGGRSVAVNPYSHRVYVAGTGGSGSGGVSVYAGSSSTSPAFSINTPDGDAVAQSVAVDTTDDIAYATQEGGIVTVISGVTGQIIKNVNVTNPADEVAVNPLTHKAYATAGSSISVIDGATYQLDANSPVSTDSIPWAIGINPVTNKIFISNQDDDDVTVFDVSTDTRNTPSAGTSPQALVVDPVNNVTYVAAQGGGSAGSIAEIDANNNINSVTLSPYGGGPTVVSPDSIAYNPINNIVYGGSSAASLVFDFQGGTFGGSTSAFAGAFGAGSPIATAVNPAAGMNYTLFQTGSTPFLAVGDDVAPYGFYVNVCFQDPNNQSHLSIPQVMDVNTVTDTVFIGCSDGNIDIIQGANGYTSGTRTTITNPNSQPAPLLLPRRESRSPTKSTSRIGQASPVHGSISIIDGSYNTILNSIVLGGPVASLAVNQASNKIYALVLREPARKSWSLTAPPRKSSRAPFNDAG